ncbi:MAG: hypothetical protein CMP69_04990 [Flavobacteriales bacterium]|nr:hypothetical protein [Flavobacteriales bacterium]
MNKIMIKYFFLAIIYTLLQVLVLNEILFNSYIIPFLYIILIIKLPLKIQKWFLILFSFFIGFVNDLFSSTIGFHSTACVLIGFLKPMLGKISIPYNLLNENDEISLEKIGYKSFIVFSFILILIHSSCLFFIEHLDFNFKIFIKIISSSIISLIVIIITELAIKKQK